MRTTRDGGEPPNVTTSNLNCFVHCDVLPQLAKFHRVDCEARYVVRQRLSPWLDNDISVGT